MLFCYIEFATSDEHCPFIMAPEVTFKNVCNRVQLLSAAEQHIKDRFYVCNRVQLVSAAGQHIKDRLYVCNRVQLLSAAGQHIKDRFYVCNRVQLLSAAEQHIKDRFYANKCTLFIFMIFHLKKL